jgi:hypothetical protein
MINMAPFSPSPRAQTARLALIRMGLRRESRLDTSLGSEVPVPRIGYFGLKMHLRAAKALKLSPVEAQTYPHWLWEPLLVFLRIKRPQFV